MKVIYMEQTVALMSPKEAEQLISLGQIKQIQEGINYLLTIIDDGDSIVQQEV